MPTLLVSPRVTPDTETMLAAARAAGWRALRLERPGRHTHGQSRALWLG